MKPTEIIEKLNSRKKGTYISLKYTTSIESTKAGKQNISVTKELSMVVRWGITYGNIKGVNISVDSNYTPWYKHNSINPYILEHLKDNEKKYLQVFSSRNHKNHCKVKYFINDKEVSREDVINSGYVNNSEFNINKDKELLVMSLPISKIISIGE